MAGGMGLSYVVYVPTSEVEIIEGYTRIRYNGNEYYDFPVATLPPEHHEMSPGWDKWQDWNKHEEWAKGEMLKITRKVFPEMEKVSQWPLLWITCSEVEQGEDASKKVWTTWENVKDINTTA